MATQIPGEYGNVRFTNEHANAFMRLARTDEPKALEIFKGLNTDEQRYLASQASAIRNPDAAGTADASTKRLVNMEQNVNERSKGGLTTGAGVVKETLDPAFWDAALQNVKTTMDLRGWKRYAAGDSTGPEGSPAFQDWASRQGQVEGGLAPLVDNELAREGDATTLGLMGGNLPTSAANLAYGLGEMGSKLGKTAVGGAMMATGAAGGAGNISQKGRELASEGIDEFSGMVGELMHHVLFKLPIALGKAGIGKVAKDSEQIAGMFGLQDYIGFEEWAKDQGLNSEELVTYLEEDPVGTILFAASYFKGVAKYKSFRAKTLEATAGLKEATSVTYPGGATIKGQKTNVTKPGDVPKGGTLDRAKATGKDPTAVVEELVGFSKVGSRPVPEGHYTLSQDVGGAKAGDTVSATFLRKNGFDIGKQLDKRVNRPSNPEFYGRAWAKFRELIKEEQMNLDKFDAGKIKPDEHAALWDAAIELSKEEFRAKNKKMYEERARILEEYGLTEDSVAEKYLPDPNKATGAEKRAMLEKITKLIYEEELKLKELRDPVSDAIRPEEIASVAKKFPVAWNSARTNLFRLLDSVKGDKSWETTSGRKIKFTQVKSALLDELQMIFPTMSRRHLRTLAKKQSNLYAAQETFGGQRSSVPVEVAWLIEKIASERAKRGQSNTPITAPVGKWRKADIQILERTSQRIRDFWSEDIRAGEELARPTARKAPEGDVTPAGRRVANNPMPGERAAVAYEGNINGQELWVALEDKHGFKEGQLVTSDMLIDMGFEIEHPVMPKANGTQGPTADVVVETIQNGDKPATHVKRKVTEAEEMTLEVVKDSMPDAVVGNATVHTTVMQGITDIVGAFADFTRPVTMRMERLGKSAEPLMTAMNEFAASIGHSGIIAGLRKDTLYRRLSAGGKRSTAVIDHNSKLFGEFLHEERRLAVEQRKAEFQAIKEEIEAKLDLDQKLSEVDKENLRIANALDVDINLPVMDPAKLARFKATPEFAIIDKWWRDEVQLDIESYADAAGITGDFKTPGGYYFKANYVLDRAALQGKDVQLIAADIGRAENLNLSQKTKTKAKAARMAKGRMPAGSAIDLNLESIIHNTLKDRLYHGAKRTMRKEIIKWDHSKRKDLKPGMRINKGKDSYVLAELNELFEYKEGTRLISRDRVLVPREIAEAYRKITDVEKDTRLRKLLSDHRRAMTGLALVTPAEAAMHSLNVLHTGALMTDWGLGEALYKGAKSEGRSALNANIQKNVANYWTVAGRMVGMLYKIHKQGPEWTRANIERWSKVGALRMSDMVSEPLKARPDWNNRGYKIIGKPSEWAHQLGFFSDIKQAAFGLPDKSIKFSLKPAKFREWVRSRGIETQVRLAVLEAMEIMEPGKSDVYYANHLNNYMGTYVNKLVPSITKLLLNVDPFARAGTGHVKAGLVYSGKVAIDPIKMAKNLANGTFELRQHANTVNAFMTAFAIAAANKKFNGHWPWEDDIGAINFANSKKPGDIAIPLDDGRRLDIPFRLMSGTLYKGLNYSGVKGLTEAYTQGETNVNALGQEVLKSWINLALSRIGPHVRVPIQAATEHVPYMTDLSEMSFMKAVDPTASTPGRIMGRVQAGLQPIMPLPGKAIPELMGTRKFDAKTKTWPGFFAKLIADSTGAHTRLRAEDVELQAAGRRGQKREKLVRKVASSIFLGASRLDEAERGAYIQEQVEERFDDDEFGNAEKYAAIMQIISMFESYPDKMVDKQMVEQTYRKGQPGHVMPDMP